MGSPTPAAQSKPGNQRQKPNSPSRPTAKASGVTQKMQNISPSKPAAMYDVSAAKKRVR